MTLRIPNPSDVKRQSKGDLSALFREVTLALANPDPEVLEVAEGN